MPELKTNKDFWNELREHNKDNGVIVAFIDAVEERQKQEAIKRWKHFKKEWKWATKKGFDYTAHHFVGKMDEIKDFNDLTAEDLK